MYDQSKLYKVNCSECSAYKQNQCKGQEESVVKMDGNMALIYGLEDNPKLYEQFKDTHQYTCQVTGMTKAHDTEEIPRFLVNETIEELI